VLASSFQKGFFFFRVLVHAAVFNCKVAFSSVIIFYLGIQNLGKNNLAYGKKSWVASVLERASGVAAAEM